MERCCFCFETLGEDGCEGCAGSQINASPDDLPVGTSLGDGQFVIGRVLGHGSFGTTYLAWDPILRRKVVVREFLPAGFAARDPDTLQVQPFSAADLDVFEFARQRFREEAQLVCQFRHPNIVQVLGFLRDRGTDYLVTEHFDGVTLAEYVQRHGPVPERPALDMTTIVLAGLAEVHRERNGVRYAHRNVKPSNVFLASIGESIVPKLVDFGAARLAVGERSRDLAQVLSPGYAALEQYRSKGVQGPWTDVYGIAATLLFTLSAVDPPSAIDRLQDIDNGEAGTIGSGLSDSVAQAVRAGMTLDPGERPQDAMAFRELLVRCP